MVAYFMKHLLPHFFILHGFLISDCYRFWADQMRKGESVEDTGGTPVTRALPGAYGVPGDCSQRNLRSRLPSFISKNIVYSNSE